MGNSSSSSPKMGQQTQHIGKLGPLQTRNNTHGFRQPMPDENEVERRFNLVLQQMDLPPERAKILRGYDISKKWEMICDHVSFIVISSYIYLELDSTLCAVTAKFLWEGSETENHRASS